MSEWSNHVAKWKDCDQCPLAEQRFRICLARGTVPCDVLFIGEAPGASEDATGLPFSGPAGNLLQQVIDRALIGIDATYALTNLVCCFPRDAKERGENEPEYSEIMSCRPRLVEFINVAQPRIIVAVGSLAEQYVPNRLTMRYHHITHPAAILHSGTSQVQKQQIVHRMIVITRTAVEDALQHPCAEWEPWETGNAESKTKRKQLREQYQRTDPNEPPW